MIRKAIALFLLYVILLTFAPELASLLVGMLIAIIVTAINLLTAVVRPILSQVSGQDVTTGAVAIFLTVTVIVIVWGFARLPVGSSARQSKK